MMPRIVNNCATHLILTYIRVWGKKKCVHFVHCNKAAHKLKVFDNLPMKNTPETYIYGVIPAKKPFFQRG